MLLPVLMLIAQDAPIASALNAYRDKTRADIRCDRASEEGEIIVCARRESYRHQLPLVSTNPRNNAREQENILATPEAQGITECGQGAFMVRCGSVGVGASVGLGGSGYVRRAPPP